MIPLISPTRQNEPFVGMFKQKVEMLMSSTERLNQEIELLEMRLAEWMDYRECITCASGTLALELALRALKLPKDAEVITPAYSYVGSANVIAWAGLTPVFADVDLDTQCLTPKTVRKVIGSKTAAIIIVDMYGRQSLTPELRKLCKEMGLYIIRDGAHSLGSPNTGAHFYTTSFNPRKPVGALGNSGALLTNNPELATRVRELRSQGSSLKDHHTVIGTNGWMDPLHAALLNLKWNHLPNWENIRTSMASWYQQEFVEEAARKEIILPASSPEGHHHTWGKYTVFIPGVRDKVLGAMAAQGVECGTSYFPLPAQPSLKPFARGEYPNAVRLGSEVLNIPMFPELTGKEMKFIVESLKKCLKQIHRPESLATTWSSSTRSSPRTLDR